MTFDFISTDKFVAVDSFALLDPPTWTRLEPQSVTGDPSPGVEASVHDPLWLLGRQWQLGEFEGEDSGTPLTVRIQTRTIAVDRWAAGDRGAAQTLYRERQPPLEPCQDLLEPWVEREPVAVDSRGPGLRPRAEAAAVLLAALDDEGVGAAHRSQFREHCPLEVDHPLHLPDDDNVEFDALKYPDGEHAGFDPAWIRLTRLLRGRGMADGELIARAFENAAPDLPTWLVVADDEERETTLRIVDKWREWYRAEVSPLPAEEDAWVGDRLEYHFRIAAGERTLDAPAHSGGDIDWYSFDAASEPLEQPADAPLVPAEQREIHALLATPLRYPGMPADRLWEMEDAQVNLGLIEAEPWDLARLLVTEFALTYGNDWLVIPLDVPFGSLTTVESVVYTTTFGERFRVQPTATVSPDERWRMFSITAPDGSGSEGLLTPPAAVAVHDGPALEEVLFLRDEMANMCWAVERSVQGPTGAARDRSRERDDPRPIDPGPVSTAQLDYLLQTAVPARWIPYLPQSAGYRAIELVQGAMTDAEGKQVVPLGRLLQRTDVRHLKDAEIPREGIMVRRQDSMTRRADGHYMRWTTRRVSVGRGEGSSRLAFDSAISRKPRPNEEID